MNLEQIESRLLALEDRMTEVTDTLYLLSGVVDLALGAILSILARLDLVKNLEEAADRRARSR